MPDRILQTIQARSAYPESKYKPHKLDRYSLPTFCKEMEDLFSGNPADLYVFDPDLLIWRPHRTIYAGRSLSLVEAQYKVTGHSGPRASLTFTVKSSVQERAHADHHLVICESDKAQYHLLEPPKDITALTGVHIERKRVPGHPELEKQSLIFLKKP